VENALVRSPVTSLAEGVDHGLLVREKSGNRISTMLIGWKWLTRSRHTPALVKRGRNEQDYVSGENCVSTTQAKKEERVAISGRMKRGLNGFLLLMDSSVSTYFHALNSTDTELALRGQKYFLRQKWALMFGTENNQRAK
jgi:hypothetical protein